MPTGYLNAANEWYNSPGAQYYPGQTVAGMNPYQTQGIDAAIAGANQSAGYSPELMNMASANVSDMRNFAMGGGGQATAGQAQAGQVGSQYTDMLGAQDFNNIQGNFEVNPFINDQAAAFGQASQRHLEQNLLPSTTSTALGAGQMGSTRHGIAQGLATANLGQSLQEATAGLYGNAWQNAARNQLQSRGQTLGALGQERGRGTQAAMGNAQMQTQAALQNAQMQTDVSMGNARNQLGAYGLMNQSIGQYGNAAAQAAGLNMMPGQAMMAGGNAYQNTAQRQIDAERQRWDFYQNQPLNRLGAYGNMVQGAPNMGQGQVPGQVNPWASGLAGAGTGLNMAGMLGLGGGGAAGGGTAMPAPPPPGNYFNLNDPMNLMGG